MGSSWTRAQTQVPYIGRRIPNHYTTRKAPKMANFFKMENNKCWQRYGEIGNFIHCWQKCKIVQPLWKTFWQFIKKLNIELPYDPAVPFWGIYLRELKMCLYKNLCMNVHSSIIHSSPKAETQMSIDWWMAKQNGILFSQKKEWRPDTCYNVNDLWKHYAKFKKPDTTTEARTPRARAPQQGKPPQWEAHPLQRRVAPAHRN